jgi:putative glutamine amidotransferase
MPPVIAIPPCAKLHDYEESVRRAGGEPWVLDRAATAPADALQRAGGLLLAGGGDVHPSHYRETPHPTFAAPEPGRDEYEIEMVRRALEADLPVLAICRGIQLLNVARGGTLVQDIPSQVAAALDHAFAVPPHQPSTAAHEIWIETDSRLAAILRERLTGASACDVNSRHHQAVGSPGEGLAVTATAPDGVIEAIEDPAHSFCIGVQWHPENFYRTGEFRPLFEAFIEAAQRRT